MIDAESAMWLYDQGVEAMGAGEPEQALEFLHRALKYLIHFKTLERIGDCYLHLGDTTSAIVYLSASALLNPGAKSRRLLAAAFLEQGYFEESRRFAQEALQRAPGYRAAKEILAEAERLLSQSDCDHNRNETD